LPSKEVPEAGFIRSVGACELPLKRKNPTTISAITIIIGSILLFMVFIGYRIIIDRRRLAFQKALGLEILPHGQGARHRSNSHSRDDHNEEDLREVVEVVAEDIRPAEEVCGSASKPVSKRQEEKQ